MRKKCEKACFQETVWHHPDVRLSDALSLVWHTREKKQDLFITACYFFWWPVIDGDDQRGRGGFWQRLLSVLSQHAYGWERLQRLFFVLDSTMDDTLNIEDNKRGIRKNERRWDWETCKITQSFFSIPSTHIHIYPPPIHPSIPPSEPDKWYKWYSGVSMSPWREHVGKSSITASCKTLSHPRWSKSISIPCLSIDTECNFPVGCFERGPTLNEWNSEWPILKSKHTAQKFPLASAYHFCSRDTHIKLIKFHKANSKTRLIEIISNIKQSIIWRRKKWSCGHKI